MRATIMMMSMRRGAQMRDKVLMAAVAASAIALSGCGSSSDKSDAAPTAEASTSADTSEATNSGDVPARPTKNRKAVHRDTVQAGDVRIDEDSDGHSRIHAGDVTIED